MPVTFADLLKKISKKTGTVPDDILYDRIEVIIMDYARGCKTG